MRANGVVINAFGRMFTVKSSEYYYQSVTKAKKTDYVVGDNVVIDIINEDQAQIIELLPRNSLVYRSDRHKSKQIASNVDQIIIVTAVKPNYNLDFISNCLIFAESEGIQPLIVVNKADLPESVKYIELINSLYGALGYKIIILEGINSVDTLLPFLSDKTNLLIGQSGVGKSTITNQVLSKQSAKTNEIMKSDASGKHTTTNANMYFINENSRIIDCPGLQEFGLYHLEAERLVEYFPEFKPHIGKCKFANCKHLEEPKCVIKELYQEHKVNKYRYEYYMRLMLNVGGL